MHIILTHEQADFDALASLLGAGLMYEQAIPVLPRRVNRNVRAFLNLYSTKLPFVEPQDLPPENIAAVTLVDTQSLVTLKGLNSKTEIFVIDHHQERENLPAHWRVTLDHVGACTTTFVEHLRERHFPLSPIHATLLQLGIYEDTGSLSYVGTTSRDILAAAYLLEQGAALQIVAEYLNPPLSPTQRKLYDGLLKDARYYTFHGQKIVIACGDATWMNDEISSVAHKIRDLLELDALFLLVKTSEGIRMVARSTSDKVNVADIAARFGGGGHDRAAAALIQPEQYGANKEDDFIGTIYKELMSVLPRLVQPAVAVEQIMSRQPMLLSPHTSVHEALKLMQRYGYEGYPVVDKGKVVGLLTRRAVDRALSHKLELTAASLMEAGEVTVKPKDALEDLQRVMSTSGWGQIPVVDDETHQVIGIVTRTDLLVTMNGLGVHKKHYQNLASQLENILPPVRLVFLKKVAEEAYHCKIGVYIVGGFVRDLLLESPSLDFDVVVEGDAISLGQRLVKRFGGRVITHRRFGTAKWIIADSRSEIACQLLQHANQADIDLLPASLDLISARTEFYEYPTALPTVMQGSIKLDLHRRDFSINTMAIRLDGRHFGELYDYWGGVNDLNHRLVRVLHSLSFVDDPTRSLRAVRFEQRFGFSIESRTLQLMEEGRSLMRQVSGDRLRHELNLILEEKQGIQILERLQQLDLLSGIHPELKWESEMIIPMQKLFANSVSVDWNLPQVYTNIPVKRFVAYLIWFSCHSQSAALDIVRRLRFAAAMQQALNSVYDLKKRLPEMLEALPSTITAYLDKTPAISLYTCSIIEENEEVQKIIETYILKWSKIKPATDGRRLRQMGVKPGPAFRTLLEKLRNGWLDGDIQSDEQEKNFLEQCIAQLPENNCSS